jgi:hypothetical protein
MGQFERDWLELGRRVACSLHYQHPRNLRLTTGHRGGQTARPGNRRMHMTEAEMSTLLDESG